MLSERDRHYVRRAVCDRLLRSVYSSGLAVQGFGIAALFVNDVQLLERIVIAALIFAIGLALEVTARRQNWVAW